MGKSLNLGPISGEIVTVWAACWSDDERGAHEPRAYYLQESAAWARASKAGWYGADGSVSERRALRVGEDYYLLSKRTPTKVVDLAADKRREALKAAALAKLKPEELEALLGDGGDEGEEDEDES